ncbi:hypothetical protein RJ40_05580 [Methanofollis aquaemaris]|uniref:Uncharacterized protein n=1 Tax=Methanofollis aquaemaris TaxID=126734 RepID=A0A8A3S5J7_9EURY|nr:hypothetical protein [Methanofollis aquaemaris]QSZ67001.1 hypothetical protein RJ40_05580 [Methanofollis aquaemaris]
MNGTLRPGADETLHIFVGRGHFRIAADDLRALLSRGKTVPVTTEEVETNEDGTVTGRTAIVGHAAVNPAGRAVKVFTTVGHFIVPLVSVRRVVRGEAASAPLFPLIPEGCP